MTDFSSLQTKVNDLKAKVTQNSISPSYLGALLDDFIAVMKNLDMTGLGDDVANAVRNAQTALNNANQALTKAGNAETAANSALQNALSAINTASQAISLAQSASADASSAKSTANALNSKIGQPNGIAPLDENAKVPAANLPGYVDDVIEFNAIVSDITVQDTGSLKKSTDSGCMIVYNSDTNKFLLAVSSIFSGSLSEWGGVLRPNKGYLKSDGSISTQALDVVASPSFELGDYWERLEDGSLQLDRNSFKYYSSWADQSNFGEDIDVNGVTPEAGKVYICTSDNKTYRWASLETGLVAIGSDLALGHTANTAFPGDEGMELKSRLDMAYHRINGNSERIDQIGILPCDGQWDGTGRQPSYGVWLCPNGEDGWYFRSFGSTNFYGINEEIYNSDLYYNEGFIYRIGNNLYHIVNDKLEAIEGSAVGNTFNVTIAVPLPTGEYYNDLTDEVQKHNVLEAVYNAGKATLGIMITFAVAADEWKDYKYIGPNITKPQFIDVNNWKEFGGAGGSATGNVINIHEISGDWSATNRGAAAALVPEKLRMGGRKITFMYAAGKWQTWQFTGSQVSDWNSESFWRQEIRSVSINGAQAPNPDGEGNVDLAFSIDIDDALNAESSHPVANKAIVAAIGEVESIIPQNFSFDAASRMLNISDAEGNPIASVNIPGGGDGSGSANPTAIEITVTSDMIATVKEGDDYTLEYEWRHYNINSNVDTQYGGVAELIVQGSVVERVAVIQGFNTFNVGPWLNSGLNTVRVRITADDGVISQSANVKITAVTLTLRSLYDISTANIIGSPMQIRYVVTGSGEKKVSFKLANEDAGTETVTTSGSTSVKNIPTAGKEHGIYRVDMQATRDLGNSLVLASDILSFDVLLINQTSSKPLIALERPAKANQYSTIEIPFAVFDPENAQSALVEVYLGDDLVDRMRVDRSRHTFSYRVKEYGPMKFTFKVQNSTEKAENSVTVDVVPASTQVSAETDALTLYLSSSGRSNEAENRDDWSFSSDSGVNTKAQFSDCNFDSQSGWIKDGSGLTALHLEKGASCYIPLNVFASDAKLQGKTIEIEFMVSNCFDDDAEIISCVSGNVGFSIKAQEATFSSALRQTVSSKFKQDERIRIGFQVEPVAGTNRFMYLFLNGKMSGVIQYDTNDYFVQSNPVGISLGHPSCELNVYNIRVYENVLSFQQMVNNYIADMDDTDVMFAKLEANDILNEDSVNAEISYDKAVEKIPCITFIGELPTFKGDKKKGTKIIYEDRLHPEFSFTLDNAQNDVQGTSSQYYPRKNWKFKALSDFVMSQTGQSVSKYALRGVDGYGNEVKQKAVKTFCLKADFAESSGTHNTGAANLIHEVLRGAGVITPMQVVDDTVRTTIFGFPILMFHQENEASPRKFVGKYNFNNDKSTHDTFGFQDIPGFNKGMVNRDDYLVWEGSLSSLQGDSSAVSAAEDAGVDYYLIENGSSDPMTNHLVSYDSLSGAWVDKGEMWRWDAESRQWKKNDGTTCTRAGGIMAKVDAGEFVENNIECWEFLNNGHPMCLFQESDYSSRIYSADFPSWIDSNNCFSDSQGKYTLYWTGAFEPRYPDNDDLNRLYARGRIPKQLKRVTDWLASLSINSSSMSETQKNNRAATFASQVDNYFNKQMLMAYDLLREFMVMSDQGAKNMMALVIDGLVYLIFYDNDTIWLINNEGRISFTPYVEPHSVDELGKFVFNGESSTLWNLIERSLTEEKRTLFNSLVSQGGLTYDRCVHWFNKSQCDKWCETVYNADSKYKYIDSFGTTAEDGTGSSQNYLDIAQGSREEHRKWAMYERSQYMNAKYAAGSFRDNSINFRVNTAGSSSVPAKVSVDITAAQDWYFCFRFSANAGFNPQFVKKGETATFSAPSGSNPNDTECYVHQADRISDLGDLSPLYLTTCVATQGRMLTRLVIGNKTRGYIGKLANLTLGTHPLMTYINVCNIPTLSSSLNLLGCSAMDEVEAQGSHITGVQLPSGSVVSKMHLPETIVQLQFDRLTKLTNDNLVIDGYQAVQTVNITDCTFLNPMQILDLITATPNNSLQYVRVTGGTLRGTGEELVRLVNLNVHGALNKNGKPEVLGVYEMIKLPDADMLSTILNGINPDGFSVVIVVEAFTNEMDAICCETYSGEPEVDEVSYGNIADHIRYFNGETYQEWMKRQEEENQDIHELIKS